MFENIMKFFKKIAKKDKNEETSSKDAAKERLHLVLMQDRANVSADFLELMKQEIIDVIKKYIDIDEGAIDVRLTNKENDDGTNGAPALYANIPIINIKNDIKKSVAKEENNKDTEKAKKSSEEKEEHKEKKEKVEEENEKAEIIIDNNENNNEQEENVNVEKEQEENDKDMISEVIIDNNITEKENVL